MAEDPWSTGDPWSGAARSMPTSSAPLQHASSAADAWRTSPSAEDSWESWEQAQIQGTSSGLPSSTRRNGIGPEGSASAESRSVTSASEQSPDVSGDTSSANFGDVGGRGQSYETFNIASDQSSTRTSDGAHLYVDSNPSRPASYQARTSVLSTPDTDAQGPVDLQAAVQDALQESMGESSDSFHFMNDVWWSLQRRLHNRLGRVWMRRVGSSGGQWMVKCEALPDTEVCVSLRLQAPEAILRAMRSTASSVRRTLLGSRGTWLRAMNSGDQSVESFIDAVREARQRDGEQEDPSEEVNLCWYCGISLRRDHLPGAGHHCRIIVTFHCVRCRKSWTTQRGRYSLREGRVRNHDCATCKVPGEVSHWEPLTEEGLRKLQQRRDAAGVARDRRTQQAASTGAWHADNQWWQAGWSQAVPADSRQSWHEQTWANYSPTHGIRDTDDQESTVSWQESPSQQAAVAIAQDAETQDDALSVATEADGEQQEEQEPSVAGAMAVVGEVTVTEEAQARELPRIRTQPHQSELCEACRMFGDCSGFFAEPLTVMLCAKMMMEEDGSDELAWEAHDGALHLVGFDQGEVSLIPHVYEMSARVSPEEASRIVHWQTTSAQTQQPSGESSSSSSTDQSIRSSDDAAMRAHFRVSPAPVTVTRVNRWTRRATAS